MTLVFIHGAGSHAGFWHAQCAAFPQAHYLNLPGHIERTKDKRQKTKDVEVGAQPGGVRLSITDYADWVSRWVVEESGLEQVVLNGHSMGGAVALELALCQPPWLAGVILTSTGARLPVSPRLLGALRSDYPRAIEMITEWSFAHGGESLTYGQRARIEGTRRQMLRTPQSVTLGDYEACNRFDVASRLAEVRVPTLCIVGAQDRMTPPEWSEELHSGIEGSRLLVIERAGHMMPMERVDEYNEAMMSFTEKLSSHPSTLNLEL